VHADEHLLYPLVPCRHKTSFVHKLQRPMRLCNSVVAKTDDQWSERVREGDKFGLQLLDGGVESACECLAVVGVNLDEDLWRASPRLDAAEVPLGKRDVLKRVPLVGLETLFTLAR
jgi:hypothetical protein